jgi:carboxyl-terminal processing protease
MRRRRSLLILLVAALVAACSPQRVFSPRLTSQVVETPTPAAVQVGAGLSAEQGLALISQAFVILLDQYVEPVDPVALLRAAWDGFAGALPAGQARPEPPVLTGTTPAADFARFRRSYLEAASLAGGAEMQAHLAREAVRKMVTSLGDCHTSYVEPQQMQEQLARLRGNLQFGGIGVRIKRRPNEPVIVWELLEGGSAGKAGIRPGDAILKVDGRDTATSSLEQIAAAIRGPEGTQVRLTVERADGRRVQDVTLKRVAISEPPFQGKLLRGNIGYLRLHSFSTAGQSELLQGVRSLETQGVKGWIIDLRTNGGGELPVFTSLLSKFLKDGPFGFQVDRRGQRLALGPDGSYLPRQHPMVVLVGDSTSSAAELFAAAIQHFRAGTVIGTKTAGCVGIATPFRLDDESGLYVSVSKLLGPGGEELNKRGLTPDEVIEITRSDLAAGKDPQLERALAILGAPAR